LNLPGALSPARVPAFSLLITALELMPNRAAASVVVKTSRAVPNTSEVESPTVPKCSEPESQTSELSKTSSKPSIAKGLFGLFGAGSPMNYAFLNSKTGSLCERFGEL
jgi:hypothetical protein